MGMVLKKKEMKDRYKDMKFKIGVFQIRNIDNNKIYVESRTDLSDIIYGVAKNDN